MFRLPSLSLMEEQLPKKGKKTTSSSNGVRKITFEDKDGKIKTGYFKPCRDGGYTEILAKYVVAFSIFVRTALGTRASEERLVYNNKNQIIGTVSIEVPNFVRLLTQADADYENPILKKWGNPDKQTLLDMKVAELLISAYKHKSDDLHPANMSVHGLIDWDDLYRELTSILKGDRLISGWTVERPKEAGILKEEHLRTFPRIPARTHWPTNFIPKNLVLSKNYKTSAFLELEGDVEFKRQYFAAIVKELLAYDENMIQERLKLYLGNEDLSLGSLTTAKREALLAYGSEYSLFDDLKDNPNPFVTHCMRFYRMEHKKFEKMVLGMPEFRDFMVSLNKKPCEISEIKNWFAKNNLNNPVPYNLEYIDQQYNYLWRESF